MPLVYAFCTDFNEEIALQENNIGADEDLFVYIQLSSGYILKYRRRGFLVGHVGIYDIADVSFLKQAAVELYPYKYQSWISQDEKVHIRYIPNEICNMAEVVFLEHTIESRAKAAFPSIFDFPADLPVSLFYDCVVAIKHVGK